MPPAPPRRNQALLWPYVVPFLVYVGIASLPSGWLSREASYGLRLVATAGALAWAWRHLVPLRGPGSPAVSVAVGVLAGLVGTVLWIALKAPFYAGGGEPWAPAAFGLRLAASGLVVPLFEEWLFRGYLLRLGIQWDRARRAGAARPFAEAFDRSSVNEVAPGDWTPLAVAFATLAFAAGHQGLEWPAALAYGLWMAGLWVVRKDLLSCVVAHATTNVALGLWIRATGHWALW